MRQQQNMKHVLAFTADFHPGTPGMGYLTYRRLPDGEFVARTERVDSSCHVDFDARGEVIGIELIGLGEGALAVARAWATAHGLVFPALLAPRPAPAS
jgi:hypothetical protein